MACLPAGGPADRFHLGHSRDAGQGLATKAERADSAHVLETADLARGMALERYR